MAKKTALDKQITWPNYYGGRVRGGLAAVWNVDPWPAVYVIGLDGVIRYKGHDDDGLKKIFLFDSPLHLSSSGLSTLPSAYEGIISAQGFPDAGSRKLPGLSSEVLRIESTDSRYTRRD